jgi:hypothetical protein
VTSKLSSTDLELAIVLPLGVLAHQLMRIEAQLRLVNMKALDLATESDHRGSAALINAKLEHISEALDSIRTLVSDLSHRKPKPEQDD